jgi:hypothetical protein
VTRDQVANLITILTPVVVPLLVAGVKQLSDRVPKLALPVLAIILGAVADTVNYYATGGGVGIGWGAILGAAGVGLREVVDQVKQTAPPKSPVEMP